MSSKRRTPRILIIDDCSITCELLVGVLSKAGYQVHAAGDGLSGLASARAQQPDLAVVDLHLPDLSGIELAGLLQPEVPFLALTIDRSEDAVRACIEKGALGYLVKPLDAESFLRQVAVALERGREQRNLRRALRDNHIVNKALGVMMGFHQIPEQKAFELLVGRASARNVKAVVLAQEIIRACEALSDIKTGRDPDRAALDARQARAVLNRFRPSR